MTTRITKAMIQTRLDRINERNGEAMEPYTKDEDGSYRTNVGNYHLEEAYGGCQIVRMANSDGGTNHITYGYLPKRECLAEFDRFIAANAL